VLRRRREPEVIVEEPSLTREEFEKMQCVHCGGAHLRACPRVKRLVFNNSNNIQEVEFWRDGEWSQDSIIWPEEIEE
jgi:hypothetical protein